MFCIDRIHAWRWHQSITVGIDFFRRSVNSSVITWNWGSFFCLLFLNMYQRYLHPIQAAIIYALEPVWATIYGLQLDMVDWSIWILIGGGIIYRQYHC